MSNKKRYAGIEKIQSIPIEERREASSKGGIQKGINSKRRKKLGEIGSAILKQSFKINAKTPEQLYDLACMTDLRDEEDGITYGHCIMLAMIREALQGNVQAATFVRDTVGDKNPEEIQTTMTFEDYVKTHKVKFK